MVKHAELIARLEAAEVGSREFDAEIWDIEDDRPRWSFGDDFPIYKRDPDDGVAFDSPSSYTTSLDAALALAERVLPEETFWEVENHVIISGRKYYSANLYPAGADDYVNGFSQTPALALCVAILRALDANN